MTNDQKILAGLAILIPHGDGKSCSVDVGGALIFAEPTKLSDYEEALLREYGWESFGKDWYAPSE